MPQAPNSPSGDYDDLGPADDTDGKPDDVYNPTAVQVTRGREQGLGMGAADLGLQQDPGVLDPADSDLDDEDEDEEEPDEDDEDENDAKEA